MTKKKDEEKDFIFPKFNEKEFIEKEIMNTKITFITLGYAVLMGFVCFILARISSLLVPVAFILGLVAIAYLRNFYHMLNLDTSRMEKGNWIGNGMMTFFFWLAVWILLSNPPITDTASPSIDHIEIFKVDNATVEKGYLVPEGEKLVEFSTYGENYVKGGDIILMRMDIVDNYKLDKDSLTVEIRPPVGEGEAETFALDTTSTRIREVFRTSVANKTNSTDPDIPFRLEDESYFLAYEFPRESPGTYTFTITARDSRDNSKSLEKTFFIQ